MELKDRLFVSTSCIAGKKSYEETFKYILKANIQNIEISGNHIYLDNSKLINLINSYKKKKN